MPSLRATAGLRVYDGFGGSLRAACRFVEPQSTGELAALIAAASAEGLTLSFRGAGRSYGDAALDGRGLAIDTRALRAFTWDAARGVAEVEPGVPLADVWRRALPDGFWPAVVPGTMFPTVGGCAAMNVHGKNNFRAGVFGEHVLALDLMLADGTTLHCTREQNAEVFHAALGGAGMLGAMTKVSLQLKPVESGRMRVEAVYGSDLAALFAAFDERLPKADYLVGWVDCFAGGSALGRGQLHAAWHLHASDDEGARASLQLSQQELPARIFGFPKSQLWRAMAPFANDVGWRAVNLGKSAASKLTNGSAFLQSHAAFAFLLDSVPNWRNAYGARGFLQHQIFVPEPAARTVFPEVLRRCQARRVIPYLGVMKRHRPDPFTLSHGLDGWSLAMDFPIPGGGDTALRACTSELSDLVIEAGGTFYLAKDQLVTAAQFARAYGPRLKRFFAIKQRLDPGALFQSDQTRRLFGRFL